MSFKPDRITAMKGVIDKVKRELPLYESDTFVCSPTGSSISCPNELMELVDSEFSYWEHSI
jgi:hypothetical protein